MYDINSSRVDISVRRTLKQMNKLIITGWILYFLGSIAFTTKLINLVESATFLPFDIIDRILLSSTSIALLFFNIAAIVIAIQLIRKQHTIHGILLIFFSSITLGIWPFFASFLQLKNMNDLKGNTVHKKNILTVLNITIITLIIALVIFMITFIFFNNYEILYFSFFIIIFSSIIISIQDIRQDKITHGICLFIFGPITFGIWPLIYAIKQTKKLKYNLY